MFKAETLVFFMIVLIKNSESDNDNNGSALYEPPSNIKFPFGDENQLNIDVCDIEINSLLFRDRPPFVPEQGRCPFPPADPGDLPLTNPYVDCPIFATFVSPGDVPLGDPVAPPSVQCRDCDLKLTEDDQAVLLKCRGCFDLPSANYVPNATERDILYKVFFIEIANYTSVKVQGRENF